MIVNFTKMHALGNDFIIIDTITQTIKLKSSHIRKIADRHTGVGCDQIILIEPPIQPSSDFYYKIYNSDGTSAEQCLNGARCAARFVLDTEIINKSYIIADCETGQIFFNVEPPNMIITNIPTSSLSTTSTNVSTTILQLKNNSLQCQIHNLSVGNPHAIFFINSKFNKKLKLSTLNLKIYESIAKEIASNPLYPNGVNVGFAKIIDDLNIELRVFERGAGETLACGSNALATFLTATSLGLIGKEANILFKLGTLHIKSTLNSLSICGSTHSVFSGKFKI